MDHLVTSITKALKNSLDQGNVRVIYFHCIEAFNGFSLLVCEYRVHLVLMWASNSGLKIASYKVQFMFEKL